MAVTKPSVTFSEVGKLETYTYADMIITHNLHMCMSECGVCVCVISGTCHFHFRHALITQGFVDCKHAVIQM